MGIKAVWYPGGLYPDSYGHDRCTCMEVESMLDIYNLTSIS